MTSAAELNRRTVFNDTHVFAIFLAKECHGTHSFCFLHRRMTALLEVIIMTDELVRHLLHLTQFFRRHFLEVREVKPQTIRRHQTTLLLHMMANNLTQAVVDNMCRGVVATDRLTTCSIYFGDESGTCISRQFKHNMYRQAVLALGVENFHAVNRSRIANLATHFCIERCFGQYDLVEVFAFLAHFTIFEYLGLALEVIIADKLRVTFCQYGPIAQILLIGTTAHLFLMLKGFVVFVLVGSHTVLTQDQFRQVKREAISILQCEHVHTANNGLTGFARIFHQLVQQSDTFVERTQESLFLRLNNRRDLLLLFHQFRICFAHIGYQLWHKLIKEGLALTEEGVTVANSTAQNTTNDITRFLITRQLTIRNSKSNRTYMVSNHAHGDIDIFFLPILSTRQLTDLVQHRLEHIRIVVGLFALYRAHQTLKAHTRINHFLRQRLQRTVGLAVELHEHDIPNLNHLRMVFVHHLAAWNLCFFLCRTAIHMYLRARTARTGITHLPEVIVLIAIDDMVCRQVLEPYSCRFVVTTQSLLGRAFEHRCI